MPPNTVARWACVPAIANVCLGLSRVRCFGWTAWGADGTRRAPISVGRLWWRDSHSLLWLFEGVDNDEEYLHAISSFLKAGPALRGVRRA